jgi:acetyl esterase/lipase
MPIGYVISVTVVAVGMLVSLKPLGRSGRLGTISFFFSAGVNESPFLGFYWVLAATLLAFAQGDLDTPVAWAALALAAASFIATPALVRRSFRAGPALEQALVEGLGEGWRTAIDAERAARLRRRLPWVRILLAPLPFFHPDIERIANISYGDAGRRNRLDVYRHRSHTSGAPIFIHLHGGRFYRGLGAKSFYARPLLMELAGQGWVCISANYRLKPKAVFPDYLVDVKKAIAWAREHASQYGGDPAVVVVAGSSAGAHLAATAALTPNDPTFQPGFEHADTTVAAAVCLYGYYGPVDPGRQPLPSSPRDYLRADAPPFLIAHGDQDTYVPVEQARELAKRLRNISTSPVVYAELPGAQHSFDILHSIRFETLIDGIEAFAAWVRSQAPPWDSQLASSDHEVDAHERTPSRWSNDSSRVPTRAT